MAFIDVELLKDNFEILSFLVIVVIVFNIFISASYRRLKNKFVYSKFGRTFVRSGISSLLIKVVIPVLLLTLLIGLQQKYNFIQLGNKENYIALVISILALYGILYTFLQFTIGYALQDKNDKYWGYSITKRLFVERLGFNIFRSTAFKLLLMFIVLYPMVSKAVIAGTNKANIASNFSQAFWEVSILIIYLLYTHLFIQSLNGMKILYTIQENNGQFLRWGIEEQVAEKYKRVFEYSYTEKTQYFVDALFNELEALPKNEKSQMLLHVIRSVFSSNKLSSRKKNLLYRLFKIDERVSHYEPFYMNNLFNRLYEMIERNDIDLSITDLLSIYGWHDYTVTNSIQLKNEDSFVKNLVRVYSERDDRYGDGCTYFRIPSIIEKRISSCDDIEKIHQHMIKREGFFVIQKTGKSDVSDFHNPEEQLILSYKGYLKDILDLYRKHAEELKDNKKYSSIWMLTHSSEKKDPLDEMANNIVYDYLIELEYTEQNKEYAVFLANQLEYKYRVSLVFYHLLYPRLPWEWQNDVRFLQRLVPNYSLNEAKFDEQTLKFVCDIIKSRGSIGHRIEGSLINWIANHITIKKLNEEVINFCISKRYISYAKLLKFIYIFSNYSGYPMNFYDESINNIQPTGYEDWKIEFIREIIRNTDVMTIEFISEHILFFCKELSYTIDHFISESDFRVFFINPFFKLSKDQFSDLFFNHYPREGIIEFLVLSLADAGYEYLSTSEASKYFTSRVKEIINRKNMHIGSYVKSLVHKANECRLRTISIVRTDEIIIELQKIISNKITYAYTQ